MTRSHIARQWDEALDPVTFGESAVRGVAGGAVMDGEGFGLPGVVLMRRTLHPAPGPWVAVGFAMMGEPIANMTSFPHTNEQGYEYVGRHLAGNMQMDGEPPRPLRLDVDDEGELVADGLPSRPTKVAAAAAGDGAIVVRWSWSMHTKAASPTGFRVYAADDLATPLVDATTGLNYVLFRGGGVHQARIEGYAHADEATFVVRAYSAAGSEKGEVPSEREDAIAEGPGTPGDLIGVGQPGHSFHGFGGLS